MSDDLTERLLAQDQDQLQHPDDYRFLVICMDCGKEESRPISKADIYKAREFYGLKPDALVQVRSHCAECGTKYSPDKEDE